MKILMIVVLILVFFYVRQIFAQTPSPDPCGTTTPTPTVSPTTSPSYDGVIISEVMVDPPTGESEWVELYNGNNFDVNLSGWKIDDIADGGSSPKSIDLTVPLKSYVSIDLSSAIFNNDTDFVRLLDASGIEKSSFEYNASIKGKTIGRSPTNSNLFCFQEPSKNLPNNVCIDTTTPTPLTSSPTPTKTPTPTPTKVLVASTRRTNIPPTQTLIAKNNTLNFKPVGDVQAAETSFQNQLTTSDSFPRFLIPLSSTIFSLLSVSSLIIRIKAGIAA